MSTIAAVHHTPAAIIVKVDTRYCEASVSVPTGRAVKLPDGSIAININYFWERKPIGTFINKGNNLPCIPLSQPRAVLIIKDQVAKIRVITPEEAEYHIKHNNWKGATVIQAGPRVIHCGKLSKQEDIRRERFHRDVFRRTNHTLIGIDKKGKLLLEFIRGRTIHEAAEILLKDGAIEAINLDGGSSSSLILHNHYYGNRHPRTILTLSPLK